MKPLLRYSCAILALIMMTAIAAKGTTVTGTLVDPTGQILANANITAEFRPNPGTTGSPVISSIKFQTDNNGGFTVILIGNDTINPSRSTYTFTICPNATVNCSVVSKVSIAGATQDISAVLNAGINQITVSAQTILPKAYSDAEVPVSDLTNVGAVYWNSSDKSQHLWDGSAWTSQPSLINIGINGQVGRDVRSFGAKGDYNENTLTGTDDTAAFQAAINSLPLYTGTVENTTAAGNPVHVGFIYGSGKFLISNTVSFGPRVGFIGLGWDATQIFLKDNTWLPGTMPTTTASATNGSKILTFTGVIPVKFLHTNRLTVSGAGIAGADFVANVLTYDNYAHTISLDTAASTTVPNTTITANDQVMFDVEPVMSGILGAGAVPTPGSTFGTRFIGFKLNCQAGNPVGHNSSCSTMRFYGAQGSKLDDVYLENFGMFGLHASGGSGTTGNGTIWIQGGLGQVPALQLDNANGFTGLAVSCENNNSNGTYIDNESDPVNCTQINNSLFISIIRLQGEGNKVALKVNNTTGLRIGTLSIAPTTGGAGTGVILENGTNHTCINFWESFRSSPDLFTTLIDDRVKVKKIPGNLINNPNGGYCQDPDFVGQLAIKSGQADVGANKGSGPIRLEGSYYNGTNPQLTNFDIDNEVTSGTTPTSTLEFTPSQNSTSIPQVRFNQLGTAAVDGSSNQSSLPICLRASSGTGASTSLPFMCLQYVLGTGLNPSGKLVVTQGTNPGGVQGFQIPQTWPISFGTTTGISFVTSNMLGVGNATAGDMSATLGLAAIKQGNTNIATSGFVRMTSGGSVMWRNNANTADIGLTKSVSDFLAYNGTNFLNTTGGGIFSNVALTGVGSVTWTVGTGIPTVGSCTTAKGGSLYSRTDGTTTTSLYVCDGTTGVWTAK